MLAHKRTVCIAGMDLAIWTFVGLFMNLIIPWFATTEIARAVVGEMNAKMAGGGGRLVDEL